jgi:hypothetical protein
MTVYYSRFPICVIIIFLFLSYSNSFSKNISLNGTWQFIPDSSGIYNVSSISEKDWQNIEVPSSWQSQFKDLRDYQGVGWYKKTFSLPDIKKTEKLFLRFNAVDYYSEVYINKHLIGKHEGGYIPFQFQIDSLILKSENEIMVRVSDPVNTLQIPHGKQNWYVQTSGIWRDVDLIIKPENFIQKLFITPSIDGIIKFNINFSSSVNSNILIKIFDPGGKQVLSDQKKINHNISFSFEEKLNNPELWSLNSPQLYTVTILFEKDVYKDCFGFRSIETRNKKIYLNNQPVFLIGALDQDFYPETIYTTHSEEYLRDEMSKAKALGLNLLRCHIKVPDSRYLKVADELGILIWCEIPNWDTLTHESAARGSELMDNMLELYWNHPSLAILGIINESWGIDLNKQEQRNWLLNEFDRIKEKAKGRLVVDNSACWGNFHIKTDLNDYHTYYSIPDYRVNFDQTVKDVSKRPDWLFSKFGDSKETGNEPLLISEFGNWGLPALPSKLPWWFSRQLGDINVSLPLGYDDRFQKYGYDKIFYSYNNLANLSQQNQFNSLKYEIESIRMNHNFSGYVITEFTDINWECNGLLDMWRNYKIFSNDLKSIQQQDIIIPRPVKYNYFRDDTIEIDLFISHFSEIDYHNLKLIWNINDSLSGIETVPLIMRTDVLKMNPLKLKPGFINFTGRCRINFELVDSKNNIISKNYTEIYIYPSLAEIEIKNILLANTIDNETLNSLSHGKSIICFIDSTTILPKSFPFKIRNRNDEWYDGNWASNLNWFRSENELFKNISFGKTFGFETANCFPKYIFADIPAEYFSDVLAGMYVGWLHLNSAYILQMNVGKGRLLLCSFPVRTNLNDPFAKHLFSNLVQYIQSPDFKPLLTLNN